MSVGKSSRGSPEGTLSARKRQYLGYERRGEQRERCPGSEFYISQVSYFLCKLGTKVNQCAFVSSVSDYFWIFGGPRKFWLKRRRRQMMPRGWIFQKWNHFHDKTTHWDAENDFCKKSWARYHVVVVQNWHIFERFDRQLTVPDTNWMLGRFQDSTRC